MIELLKEVAEVFRKYENHHTNRARDAWVEGDVSEHRRHMDAATSNEEYALRCEQAILNASNLTAVQQYQKQSADAWARAMEGV